MDSQNQAEHQAQIHVETGNCRISARSEDKLVLVCELVLQYLIVSGREILEMYSDSDEVCLNGHGIINKSYDTIPAGVSRYQIVSWCCAMFRIEIYNNKPYIP